MSEINYQALREAAERATPAMERLLMLPVDDDLLSEQELKDYGVDVDALNAFKFLTGPETVLALLDENERMCRNLIARNGEIEGLRRRAAELEKIATDYALKFQKAQDALKYAVLMRNKALSFEEAMQCTKEKYEGVIKNLPKTSIQSRQYQNQRMTNLLYRSRTQRSISLTAYSSLCDTNGMLSEPS